MRKEEKKNHNIVIFLIEIQLIILSLHLSH